MDDHSAALIFILKYGKLRELYNIGAHNERSNIDLVREICRIMDMKNAQADSHDRPITYVMNRFGHDLRYAINATKLETELEWCAKETFETAIKKP